MGGFNRSLFARFQRVVRGMPIEGYNLVNSEKVDVGVREEREEG